MCSLEKRGNIFILTLTGPGEHRLNPTLLDAISAALSRVRAESSMSSALITTAEGKFFSNGYDLAWASASGAFLDRSKLMSSKLRSLVADLISLPMPTIAAISGHCSAAAAIIALSHDYVLMRNDRGFIYMPELDIGIKIPDWWFVALIRSKIGAPRSQRELMLRAAKLTAHDALNWGIIDSAHNSTEETVRAAIRFGDELVGRKWDGHVYAQIRMRMLADVFDKIGCDESVGEVSHTRSRL